METTKTAENYENSRKNKQEETETYRENVEDNKLKGQIKKNQNGNKKIKTSKKNGNKENY